MNYTKSNNTFFAKPKDDWKDRIEVEIGDSKQPDFYPQQKICRWDNECNVSIRLKHDEKTPKVISEDGKIKWKGKDIEAHFYEINNEEHPEGASEFEVILKKKPKSNVVEFTLVDKDVEYFYQSELTQEQKDRGTFRPENVVGSYAIYAKEQKINWTDGKEYKCGKVGHIYRPKIVDSAGTEVWGDLHIENGILSVTIPQDFLDNAVYPVRHAAGLTFGYNNTGTSGVSAKNLIRGQIETGGAGTGVSIQAYCWTSDGSSTARIKYALYTSSTDALLTNGTTNVSGSLGAAFNRHWEVLAFTSAPTISAVNYKIVAWANYDVYVGYDSTDNKGVYESLAYTSSWPTPVTWDGTGRSERFFIYCTYEASGGATAVPPTLLTLGVG